MIYNDIDYMVNEYLEAIMLDKSKRNKILKASLEEFAEHGYEKASTDRISQRAEVSKGLIFHYFGSKSKLYLITMNSCIDEIMEDYKNTDFANKDFLSIIKLLMKIKYEFFIRNPLQYKLIVNGFFNSPKELKNELTERYNDLRKTGLDIIGGFIEGLPLKKNVSVENVVDVISGIEDVLESKYLYYFNDDTLSFEKYYNIVSDDFINLLNIVMYGIIDEK